MSVIFVLLGFSLSVAIVFLIIFLWSVKSGQYEDDYTPSVRMLFDDKPTTSKSGTEAENKSTNKSKTKTKN